MALLTTVSVYVADKMVSQFIKDEGYGGLKKFLFPSTKYRNRLYTIILDTVDDYERQYPKIYQEGKFPFYHSQVLFDLLNQYILFKTKTSALVLEKFKENENISPPSAEELNDFYQLFTQKVAADNKLRKLHFDEAFKSEIFEISSGLEGLLAVSNEMLKKITKVDENMEGVAFQMTALKSKYDELEVYNAYKPQGLAIYPNIDKRTERSELITKILDLLLTKTWVWMDGNVSMGKTQLSVLVAERFVNKYWISLGNLEPNQIIKVLLSELSSHFGFPVSTRDEVAILVSKIPSESLLIIDDIPRLDLLSADWRNLIEIVQLLGSQNVRIFSTSNFTIPVKLKELITESFLSEHSIPFLSEVETTDVMIAYGASKDTADLLKGIVHHTSDGHPAIVNAICRYLMGLDWKIEDNNLLQIFSGKYSDGLDDDTTQRIMNTITDETSRDLLYRLRLVLGAITKNEIDTISIVKPFIARPFEKVLTLSGLWLQKVKSDSFEMSPLVKRLNTTNLSPVVFKTVNYALGKQIISQKQLDQIKANRAILYFVNAESYDNAGFVLAIVLEQSLKNPNLFFDWGFSSFWISKELPEKMNLYLKSVIRYLQIILLRRKEDSDLKFLTSDLEKITNKAAALGLNVGHSALLLASIYSETNSEKSNSFFLLGLKHLGQLEEEGLVNLQLDNSTPIESLIWSNLLKVKTVKDFEIWLNAYSELSPTQQQKSMQGELYATASLIFCASLFDLRKTLPTDNALSLLKEYDEIIQTAAAFDLTVLIACCVKFAIRTLVAILSRPLEAVEYYNTHLPRLAGSTIGRFLICDELGRQLYYSKDHEKALKYLTESANIDVPAIFTEKIDTYLTLNEIIGDSDKQRAFDFALKAYQFQDRNQFVDESFSARVIGEYAISKWALANGHDVFYIMEEGLEKLLLSYKPSPDFQATIIRYGHVVKYFHHVLINQSLPDIDGLPYVVPTRGFFSRTNEKLLERGYYFEQRKFILAFLMVGVFEFIGDQSYAAKWARICFRTDEEEQLNPYASVMTGMTSYMILDDDYEAAIAKETEILNSINELNSSENAAQKIGSEFLMNQISDRPRTVFDSFDNLLIEHVLNFIVVRILWNYCGTESSEVIQKSLEQLESIETYFQDKTIIKLIKSAFKILLDDSKNGDDIIGLQIDNSQFQTQGQLLLYLIASCKSTTKRSLELHLALIERLEMNSNIPGCSAGYQFIVIPFFVYFWTARAGSNKADFSSLGLLVEKGFIQVAHTDLEKRLKKLFKVLCFHTDYEPSDKTRKWLES